MRTQAYDSGGRLTSVSRGSQTFGYGYDADGNVSSRTWPDGTTITAAYDSSDRMTGLTAQDGLAGSTAAQYSFAYDLTGRLTRTMRLGPSRKVHRSPNSAALRVRKPSRSRRNSRSDPVRKRPLGPGG